MTPTESQDDAIQATAPRLGTRRKWNGRGGFGFGTSWPTWHKATTTQARKLVVAEVWRQEEAARCTKAVSKSIQGQWTSWENLEHHKLTWRDIWEIEGSWLRFIIRATYDVLPTPKNLSQWVGEDPICALCQTPATLRHILFGCKTSLSQGRYTWRNNQVRRQLAITLEGRRTTTNALPSPMSRRTNIIPFVKAAKPTTRVDLVVRSDLVILWST